MLSEVLPIAVLLMLSQVGLAPVQGADCDCEKRKDLYFLLDESASIGGPQFDLEKDVTRKIIESLCPGRNQAWVAVKSFSVELRDHVDLTGNKTAAIEYMNSIRPNLRSKTNLHTALKGMREYILETNKKKTEKILLVFTDAFGYSRSEQKKEALINHAHGIRTFVCGVGDPHEKLMAYIASRPLPLHRFVGPLTELDIDEKADNLAERMCNETTDHGYCYVTGDPHVKTFDGAKAVSVSHCNAALVVTCPEDVTPPIDIEIINVYCGRSRLFGKVTCAREITIRVYETTIRITKNAEVLVNGLLIMLPKLLDFEDSNFVYIEKVGKMATVFTDAGLFVSHHKSNTIVRLPHSYQGQVCGLCGNFNGDREDDFTLKDGTQLTPDDFDDILSTSPVFEQVVQSFVALQVGHRKEECAVGDLNTTFECVKPHHKARGQCAPLIDEAGIFGDCIRALPAAEVEDLFADCTFDVCAGTSRCEELEMFAELCKLQGFDAHHSIAWRRDLKCYKCKDKGSVRRQDVTACPDTCKSIRENRPADFDCPHQPEREACVCVDGKVWEWSKCILKEDCGCLDGGTYHKKTDVWLDMYCADKRTCGDDGIVGHEMFSCPAGTVCGEDDNGLPQCV